MKGFTAFFTDKELALGYTTAKIIASPYDYKISDRVIVYDNVTYLNSYNIFHKNCISEKRLCDMLGLDLAYEYMSPYDYLGIRYTDTDIHRVFSDTSVNEGLGYCGNMVKWNNLIINEDVLTQDMQYYYKSCHKLKSEGLLGALEVLFLKATSHSSLIPNLMYLTTCFNRRSLDEIENLRFAEEAIAAKQAPLILGFRTPDREDYGEELVFNAACVPTVSTLSRAYNAMDESLYQMGIAYAIVYGTELLYHFNDIKDVKVKKGLEELLAQGFNNKSFCAEYLYTFDDIGNLEFNPMVTACFHSDTNERFENIRKFLDYVIKAGEFTKDINKEFAYFALPTFFGRMLCNMHMYAYQVARIKHATLLYKTAKETGVLSKEDFIDSVEGGGGLISTSVTDEDDDTDDGLIDLDTFTSAEDSVTPEELVEKEKEISKKRKERGSMLNAADMLKKDLHDSKYDFDINYIKNSPTDKDSYNAIAKSITMITHELTKQIKEIKTYNTGGKQNGLLNGKLDKKNLWKYKTDPHIFYNNNYKLKEMDLAFGCILDESGSMYGEKIKNGRIVMIMLHEVLNSLGINHSIIGHTSNCMYQSKILKYYQFKEEAHYTLEKPYSLIKADNRNGNCDSGALYYMQSVMKSVRNKDKIVIIFSDGQPTECTDLDLTDQVKAMEKDGIHVIGVGINFSSIKEYYPDNANGKNLKEMVDIVVNILKRYVLEKKED